MTAGAGAATGPERGPEPPPPPERGPGPERAVSGAGAAAGSLRLGGEQAAHIFSCLAEDGEDAVHGGRGALVHADVQEHTVLEGLEFHGRLVGLDLGEHFAGFDLVSHVLVPLGDDTFGHGVAELWHAYDFSHQSCESVVQSLTKG